MNLSELRLSRDYDSLTIELDVIVQTIGQYKSDIEEGSTDYKRYIKSVKSLKIRFDIVWMHIKRLEDISERYAINLSDTMINRTADIWFEGIQGFKWFSIY